MHLSVLLIKIGKLPIVFMKKKEKENKEKKKDNQYKLKWPNEMFFYILLYFK